METSLLERMSDLSGSSLSTFIPLHDHAVFCALMGEAVQQVLADVENAIVIVADSETAGLLTDDHTSITPFIVTLPTGAGSELDVSDRFFLSYSLHGTLVLLGSRVQLGDGERFSGGWSLKRRNADAILGRLKQLNAISDDALTATQSVPEPSDDESSTLAMALMAAHANAQAVQQESMARDKDDLFSVLSILKAISSKRRAHDILFVFVEQISKVVQSDRCSIVRIWGGDPLGHVMASHEDSSVVDKTIELYKYPELHQSMTSQNKIVICDAVTSDSSEPFVEELKKANINSLVVIPIVLFDQHVGSLLLRAARIEGNFSPREISFFEIVAEAASNALERAQLFESIQVANERLERLAITDGLTGLYNHRHFREHLEQEFDRASRYKQPLSCLIFDVDDFKNLNDTYGHLVGDHVLKEIAARTNKCVRKSDLVARYGGEEFVVIMPQTEREGSEIEGNAEDLLRAADLALYEAKRNGKNRIVVAPEKGKS